MCSCATQILIRIFIIKPIPKPEKDEGDIIDIIIGDGQAEKDIYDEIYTEIDILDDLVSELTERQSILFKYIIVLENKVNELERKNSGGLSKEEQEEFDAFKERIKDFPQKSQDVWDRWNEIKERRMNAKDEEGQTKKYVIGWSGIWINLRLLLKV